jgi:hypothetical protein
LNCIIEINFLNTLAINASLLVFSFDVNLSILIFQPECWAYVVPPCVHASPKVLLQK